MLTSGRPAPLVVIVAYRADTHLQECLDSLGPDVETVVVDNDPTPCTERIAAVHEARYLPLPVNVGFASAVNVALRHRDDRDVLLLNPDARITGREVTVLQDVLHRPGPRRAAVGPRLVDENGRQQLAAWPVPSPAQVWLDAVGLGRLWRGRTFVVGAALMLNARAVDALGGLDERYFLYAEEADWQLRALRAGWDVGVVPDVTVTHVGGASSSDPSVREEHFHTSGQAFARKWYGRRGAFLVRVGTLVGAQRRSISGDPAARASNRRLARRTWRSGGRARSTG